VHMTYKSFFFIEITQKMNLRKNKNSIWIEREIKVKMK